MIFLTPYTFSRLPLLSQWADDGNTICNNPQKTVFSSNLHVYWTRYPGNQDHKDGIACLIRATIFHRMQCLFFLMWAPNELFWVTFPSPHIQYTVVNSFHCFPTLLMSLCQTHKMTMQLCEWERKMLLMNNSTDNVSGQWERKRNKEWEKQRWAHSCILKLILFMYSHMYPFCVAHPPSCLILCVCWCLIS